MDCTEIIITVESNDAEKAEAIAHMTVPYGIYIEDYTNLEDEVLEVANIDIIDEELLKKDRTKSQILGFTKLNLLEMTRKNMCNNDDY